MQQKNGVSNIHGPYLTMSVAGVLLLVLQTGVSNDRHLAAFAATNNWFQATSLLSNDSNGTLNNYNCPGSNYSLAYSTI